MNTYKVKVATGDALAAATLDSISVVLIGSHGESVKRKMDHLGIDFHVGAVKEYKVKSKEDLGEILVVRLYKESYQRLKESAWFCKYVTVTSPNNIQYTFPYYKWLSGYVTVEIPQGKGIILTDAVNPIIQQQRRRELDGERSTHKWKVYAEGSPRCISVDNANDLPCNDRFSFMKTTSFGFTFASTQLEVLLKGFPLRTASWKNIKDIKGVFAFRKTNNSKLVSQMWKEDTFFGYQFLNGTNPLMIKKCFKIPDNFPVDDDMVASSMGTSTNLQKEIENGNIFLADYNILQEIPTNTINGQTQYITAPMCLLWKSPQNHIIPVAIQLVQNPSEEAPIFLPSDSEWDWTLAKIWVRNAEFHIHEIVTHLLYTHLFAEVFNIATSRQLPLGHPVHKLIGPHLRYTLEINVLARIQLIGPGGIFDDAIATGKGGIPVLLRKAMEVLTYTDLCLPDDIESRGVESIPNYFYRDDGMKIWTAMERFVSGIVEFYYESDDTVYKDPELQAWVAEIFKEGFLESKSSGIPSSLKTKAELIKYLIMIIFTCSAQHAAVNSGQRPLGNYPDEHFTEEEPKKLIKDFQESLTEISKSIKERNKSKNFTYHYLDPELIENSVSI
ncbi:hydroperoxide isomerase ALOXE3-like isoform 2-T2 [Discoglossus pictus]